MKRRSFLTLLSALPLTPFVAMAVEPAKPDIALPVSASAMDFSLLDQYRAKLRDATGLTGDSHLYWNHATRFRSAS